MKDLLLHPASAAMLRHIVKNPPQGLLLEGETGVGLATIAMAIATRLSVNPHTVRVVAPDSKGTIAIENIRTLYAATRTRQSTRNVIIIDDADAMSLPAQNALLKLLEEPADAAVFILTSHQPLLLLPTVRSRIQTVKIVPIALADSQKLLQRYGISDATLTRQLLFLAAGRPAMLVRLAQDMKFQAQYLEYAKNAKAFITGSPYQRIVLTAKLSTDREAAMTVLRVAIDMMNLHLRHHPEAQLISRIERALLAYERLAANGNVKAQLLSLSI